MERVIDEKAPGLVIFDRKTKGQQEYWVKQLSREIDSSNIALDHPRPKTYSSETDVVEFELTAEVYQRLVDLVRDGDFLLYTTLMAALKICLHKHTGNRTIVVGSPSRKQENAAPHTGNVLAIVDEVQPQLPFKQVLINVRQTLLDAYSNQHYPFERLVRDLELDGSENKCPLFDVVLALTSIHHPTASLRNDITITFNRESTRITGQIEFNRSLFEQTSIETFLNHYLNVLSKALENTGTPIVDLHLLSSEERQKLLVDWNDTRTDYARDACIQQLFEAQVEKTPQAIAIATAEGEITYQELNLRANKLARHLKTLGVGPEVLVAICAERGSGIILGMLGVLKAGGAFVPLDPGYPKDRIAFMLTDSKASVLISMKDLAGDLPEHNAHTVYLDADWPTIEQQSDENLAIETTTLNLAYMIYTSGSTGWPKGVQVQHRGLVNLVTWHQRFYGVTSSDRASQLATPAFDAYVWEVWPYLTAGASIHVPDRETVLSVPKLLNWLAAERITFSFLVTALAEGVVEAQWPDDICLKALLTGGDKLHSPPRRTLSCNLFNHYGPTEATVVATWGLVPESQADTVPSIGRPLPNTQAYLLSAELQPVPVGARGELYISGDSLARGYLNHADLTAASFVPNPFSSEPGQRLYRTGDFARYLPDGSIDFIGRDDHQVKIRGFRIELGEIEAALETHPAVRQTIVMGRDDLRGERRLAAYVVQEESHDGALSQSELRNFLAEKLPAHMVPSAFVLLETLPLTPNGKVDRRALPAPDWVNQEAAATFVSPRNAIEEVLAGIWSQVMGVETVGIHHNFFEIGGHSLLATQAISQIREVFQVELPLRALFESPTVASLGARVEHAIKQGQGVELPPIELVSRNEALPLSFAQQRLWFIDQFEPDQSTYNVPLALRLNGPLNVPALEQSFSEIVRRHESLRTTFAVQDGQPVQVINPAQPFSIPVIDLSEWPLFEREAEARKLAQAEAGRSFSLSTGPLLRVTLVQFSEKEYLALVTMHHIVSDGWSLGVLVREVGTLYEAYSQGAESPLAELPLQYADYAVWQRGWLKDEVLEQQLSYWRGQLAGAPVLELPTDRVRPAVPNYGGATQSLQVGKEVLAELKALSRHEGVTLFMTLLAAFQTLLSRLSGQEDIVVGTGIANRTRGEVEGLIGFFVNTLALRTDLSGDPSFRELLGRVREVTLGAYGHQDVPFEKLVEEMELDRGLGHTPLFQVIFSMPNTPMPELELAGVTLSTEESETETAKFDLTLAATERDGQLGFKLEYSTELFDEDTVKRLLKHLATLLEHIVADADQRLSALPLLTAAEAEAIVAGWNQTSVTYPRESSVHELFQNQVAETPDEIAVMADETTLTYADLNRRANQLAHHLQSLGVSAESRVGICLERGADLIVGLLGILKAGGAYVPLDPNYPEARLQLMLEDAGVELVLTAGQLAALFANTETVRVIDLDQAQETIAGCSPEDPQTQVGAENLAYMMYTSGSTGRPKGVSITHRNIIRLVIANDFARFAADEVFLQFAPVSFDASTFEIWGSLLNGARLAMMPPQTPSLEELGDALSRYRVTTLWLTAGLFNQMAEHQMKALGGVRQLLAGGDVLNVAHVRNTLAEQSEGWLINGYGPTETTTFACCYSLRNGDQIGASVPIGRPIANSTAYILDSEMRAVPIGVVGELYIGGDGVGRGYHNRPELTAERFVPHPFSTAPGERLYRTGDRTRYLADGRIEFCGRLDGQLKLRGFRIEVGEIESALNEYPDVQESVVTVYEEDGDKRLVAYVVAADANTSELQNYLRQRLPGYMMPSAFVLLDTLPLTPNGKVDRRALPAPDWMIQEAGATFVSPRNAIEEVLAGIWSQVLNVETVGIHHNFFEIGGHSLLATQAITQIREVFRVELPLRALFEAPTVASLGERVELAIKQGQGLALPPIELVSRTEALPLSFAQQRLWFIDQYEPDRSTYNVPLALRLSGPLNVAALEQSFSEIVRRHESLRTTFAVQDGQPVQVIHPPEPFAIPVIDFSASPLKKREEKAKKLVRAEAARPFSLSTGPLLRVTLVQLGENEHLVLMTMHHIVTDGWSLGVLVREVGTLYEAYSQGAESPLADLPLQYADYAVWQRGWLKDEVLEQQLAYWREQLAGATVLELPTDRVRPAVPDYGGATQSLQIGKEVLAELKALGRREGVTLFMTLLAAFQTLLSRLSGQEDIVVGSGIANRTRGEVEGLIGFFVNTLALRTDLSGDPSFRELLGRVREVTLGAYAHQDVPFEKLVEELDLARGVGHARLFQVAFAITNMPMPELHLPGLTLSAQESESETAKYDLTLAATEREGDLHFKLEYSTELFTAETIKRLLNHLATLLEDIVADADQPLSALRLLTAAEEKQVLFDWNQTTAAYPRESSIHELFESKVADAPESVAIVAGETTLTYAELNQRANQLAHYLQSLGVTAESRVGICLGRSAELIVGLLGILKAGGAYVPLDPGYPEARLRLMLEDAGVELVLTTGELKALFAGADTVRVIDLEQAQETIASHSQDDPSTQVGPENLAYVMYTSGSTGRPKGTSITHRNVVRLVRDTDYVKLEPSDRFVQASNSAFDAATFEIWGSLLNGARLVLIRREVAISPDDFAAEIKKQGITVMFLTTALFNQIARRVPDAFASLRYVLFGGEAVDPQWVREVLIKGAPGCLLHVYGPTENTTFSTWFPVRDVREATHTVPIGKPIMQSQAYVLDRRLQPVPIGVVGELYVGGDGLMRGYFNEPELTAEKLIPHPHSSQAGERLYRTGDLVRFRSDGAIEFVGRADSQVKIRGFRIEPDEVAAVLRELSGVEDCVVLVRRSPTGDQQLVAYCAANSHAGNGVESATLLRKQLQEKLPDYMVPSQFVIMDHLPLTPNGKVDRAALAALDTSENDTESAFIPARTPVEELLTHILANVLDLESVGANDDFFELGGHSLLATQVMSRVRETFKIQMPLSELFEHPTAAELAPHVQDAMRNSAGVSTPIVARGATEEPLPLSFGQQRLWFLDQLQQGTAAYNVPLAMRLTGPLNVNALEQSFTEIVRRHESLRTCFPERDGQPVQFINAAETFNIPVSDLSELPAAEREAAAVEMAHAETNLPFTLSTGPLLRVKLLRLSDSEHIIVVTMHHIISDGWSMNNLIEEMATLYAAYRSGNPSPLSALPIQYGDLTLWQRELMQSDVLEKQVKYWTEKLSGLSTLELPIDRPRAEGQSLRGLSQGLAFSPELSRDVKRLSQDSGTTQFMTMLAAFKSLLHRYSGQEDIVVGTTVANRNHPETEKLIGFLVNMLVLRTDLSGNPTFRELLQRVKEVTLGAYSHQDLPFDKLVEVLRPERSLSSNSLFQVVFSVHHARELTLPDLEIKLGAVNIDWQSTQFDLIVRATETEAGLAMLMTYSSDLFEPQTITRLLKHYEAWLTAVVADPDSRLLDLPLRLDGKAATANESPSDVTLPFATDQFSFGLPVERTRS